MYIYRLTLSKLIGRGRQQRPLQTMNTFKRHSSLDKMNKQLNIQTRVRLYQRRGGSHLYEARQGNNTIAKQTESMEIRTLSWYYISYFPTRVRTQQLHNDMFSEKQRRRSSTSLCPVPQQNQVVPKRGYRHIQQPTLWLALPNQVLVGCTTYSHSI